MSILDDARRLVENPPGPGGETNWCHFCYEDMAEHAPDCLWLSMPKIVVALEAAEAVLWAADNEAGVRLTTVFPRAFVRALEDLEIALSDDGDEAKG